MGIGLAGGLLAELMAADTPAVRLDRGCVLPVYRHNRRPAAHYGRPDDPVPGHVLDLITAEPEPRPVRDWLLFLGKTSAAEVAGRLERSGYLACPKGWLPWRTPRPVPVDGDWSHCALLRARGALDPGRVLTPYPALLAGLTLACGLGFRLSELASTAARSDGEATQLLSRPLHELIAAVQVTADSAVLSARRPAACGQGCDRARILLARYADGLRSHPLRHASATHLGEADVSASVIMAKTP